MPIPEGRRIYALKLVGLAAVYYGTAKLGLSLTFLNSSISAVWPPTGIALAALIFWGYRMWPAVLLGAFLANTWTGVPLYGVAGIAAGNACEALAGAYLLRRVADFRPSLERVRDVVALALLAGVLSTMISATVGVMSLLISDQLQRRRPVDRVAHVVARRHGRQPCRRSGDHGRDHALALSAGTGEGDRGGGGGNRAGQRGVRRLLLRRPAGDHRLPVP